MAAYSSPFPVDYASARDLFRQQCALRQIAVEHYVCPSLGPGGEVLTTDVARIGPAAATKVIVVISGTHGLEGLAGSLCQSAWLDRGEALPEDVAVVLVHLLNPWGCAWRRRQTEDNVDLNRNFLDFAQPLPENPYYEDLKQALHCPELAGTVKDAALAQIKRYRQEKGERAYASALFQGQYTDPTGIGYGGQAATWSRETLEKILRRQVASARMVALIDLHSGLGPYGHGMLINTSLPGSAGLRQAHAWFGADMVAIREQPEDIPYEIRGDLCAGLQTMLPRSLVVPIALEFGTQDVDRLLSLQIDDCWLMNYGDIGSLQGQILRANLQDFFYPPDASWRTQVVGRFCSVLSQILIGLKEAVDP